MTDTADLHAEADAAARDGDYWTALRHAADALHASPEDHRARTKVALCLAAVGHAHGALEGLLTGAESVRRQGYLLSALSMARAGWELSPSDSRIEQVVRRIHADGRQPDMGRRPRVPPPVLPKVEVSSRPFFSMDRESLLARAVDEVKRMPEPVTSASEPSPLPFFSEMSADALVSLLPRTRLLKLPAEQVLIEEGKEGDALYVLVRGAVEVRLDSVPRVRLGAGSLFGEMALVRSHARSATVATLQPSEILEIARSEVEALAAVHPDLTADIAQFARRRLLSNAVARSPIFQAFPKDALRRVLSAFVTQVAEPGQVLIREGEKAEGLYVLVEGSVQISKTDDRESVMVATLEPNDVFGEISMAWDAPAVATATAAERVVALRLPREAFQAALAEAPEAEAYLTELSMERYEELQTIMASEEVVSADDLLLV
ncbi:MAG: cyclic nucleotide-binding domain-containing protein [Myxococcota bacterium]